MSGSPVIPTRAEIAWQSEPAHVVHMHAGNAPIIDSVGGRRSLVRDVVYPSPSRQSQVPGLNREDRDWQSYQRHVIQAVPAVVSGLPVRIATISHYVDGSDRTLFLQMFDQDGNELWYAMMPAYYVVTSSMRGVDIGPDLSVYMKRRQWPISPAGAEELVRFDSSGAQQWSVTTFANDSSYSVGVTGDDTVFVSGQKRSTADGSLIFSEGGKYWSDADPMTHDLRIITTPSTHVGRRHAGLDNWTTSLAGFSSIADLNVSDGQKAIVVGNDANPRSRIESYLADGTYEWGEQSSGTGTAHLFGSVDSIGQDIWVAQRNFIGGDDIAPLVHRYSEDGTSHTSWTAPFPSSRPLVQIAVDHVTRIYLAYIGDQGATPSILTQLSSGGDGIWSVNLRGNSGVNIRVFHPERLY